MDLGLTEGLPWIVTDAPRIGLAAMLLPALATAWLGWRRHRRTLWRHLAASADPSRTWRTRRRWRLWLAPMLLAVVSTAALCAGGAVGLEMFPPTKARTTEPPLTPWGVAALVSPFHHRQALRRLQRRLEGNQVPNTGLESGHMRSYLALTERLNNPCHASGTLRRAGFLMPALRTAQRCKHSHAIARIARQFYREGRFVAASRLQREFTGRRRSAVDVLRIHLLANDWQAAATAARSAARRSRSTSARHALPCIALAARTVAGDPSARRALSQLQARDAEPACQILHRAIVDPTQPTCLACDEPPWDRLWFQAAVQNMPPRDAALRFAITRLQSWARSDTQSHQLAFPGAAAPTPARLRGFWSEAFLRQLIQTNRANAAPHSPNLSRMVRSAVGLERAKMALWHGDVRRAARHAQESHREISEIIRQRGTSKGPRHDTPARTRVAMRPAAANDSTSTQDTTTALNLHRLYASVVLFDTALRMRQESTRAASPPGSPPTATRQHRAAPRAPAKSDGNLAIEARRRALAILQRVAKHNERPVRMPGNRYDNCLAVSPQRSLEFHVIDQCASALAEADLHGSQSDTQQLRRHLRPFLDALTQTPAGVFLAILDALD